MRVFVPFDSHVIGTKNGPSTSETVVAMISHGKPRPCTGRILMRASRCSSVAVSSMNTAATPLPP
jgi:hypothetical protein